MCLAMLPALLPALLLVGGCSGINTTQGVSPASFFLPGLLQADPPAAPSPDAVTPAVEPGRQLAQVN